MLTLTILPASTVSSTKRVPCIAHASWCRTAQPLPLPVSAFQPSSRPRSPSMFAPGNSPEPPGTSVSWWRILTFRVREVEAASPPSWRHFRGRVCLISWEGRVPTTPLSTPRCGKTAVRGGTGRWGQDWLRGCPIWPSPALPGPPPPCLFLQRGPLVSRCRWERGALFRFRPQRGSQGHLAGLASTPVRPSSHHTAGLVEACPCNALPFSRGSRDSSGHREDHA